jgi:putative membrane protein
VNWFSRLPALNATLNGITAVLLVFALIFILNKKIAAHRACMLSAVTCSVLFLISYITYHAKAGTTHFTEPPWFRRWYIALLISHTILAAVIVPLVIVTLSRALRARFDAHKKIARWTWPIWMYVSVTGVLIYYLLYIKFPQH